MLVRRLTHFQLHPLKSNPGVQSPNISSAFFLQAWNELFAFARGSFSMPKTLILA